MAENKNETKTNEIKVPFFKASIGEREEAAVLETMRSGWLTTGKQALAFENEFAEKIGAKKHLP
jgi:dTDP-4-amino-4,6-dideoxygalactose transaminase